MDWHTSIQGLAYEDWHTMIAVRGLAYDDCYTRIAIRGLAYDDCYTRIGIRGLAYDDCYTRIGIRTAIPSTDGALRDSKRKFAEFLITVSYEQMKRKYLQ